MFRSLMIFVMLGLFAGNLCAQHVPQVLFDDTGKPKTPPVPPIQDDEAAYADAYHRAEKNKQWLIIYVYTTPRNLPGTVSVQLDDFNGNDTPRIICAQPGTLQGVQLKVDASDAQIRAVIGGEAQGAVPFLDQRSVPRKIVPHEEAGALPVGGDRKMIFNASHTCPQCGTRQTIISGSGPGNTHTHTCPNPQCRAVWYH